MSTHKRASKQASKQKTTLVLQREERNGSDVVVVVRLQCLFQKEREKEKKREV